MKVNNIKPEFREADAMRLGMASLKGGALKQRLQLINDILGSDDYTELLSEIVNYIDTYPNHEDIVALKNGIEAYYYKIIAVPGIHTGGNANIVAFWQLYDATVEMNPKMDAIDLFIGSIDALVNACEQNLLRGGTMPVTNVNLVINSADLIEKGLADLIREDIYTISISECPSMRYTACTFEEEQHGTAMLFFRQEKSDLYRLITFVREICKELYYIYGGGQVDDISKETLREIRFLYFDDNEALNNIISVMTIGYVLQAGWDIDLGEFLDDEYSEEEQNIIKNFMTFVAKRILERSGKKSQSYMKQPAFASVARNPENYFNDPDTFEFINYNPKGVVGTSDYAFQVLRHFLIDLTDQEITELLIHEQVKHGLSILDGAALDRIMRDNTDFKKYDVNAEFLSDLRNRKFPDGIGEAVVRCGSRLYIYDPEKRKFKGAHPIPKHDKISKVWMRGDI